MFISLVLVSMDQMGLMQESGGAMSPYPLRGGSLPAMFPSHSSSMRFLCLPRKGAF